MKSVNKVVAYITRHGENGMELLVFYHRGMPQAGLQVPAGTIEPHESSDQAVLREAEEETGLKELLISRELGNFDHHPADKTETHHRSYFELKSDKPLPEQWSHTVTAGTEDKDLVFDFSWIPISIAAEQLAGEQGQAIPELICEQ